MSTILDQIAEKTRLRVEAQKNVESPASLARRAQEARVPLNFLNAFEGSGINVIAEVKRASPSEGEIAPDADPVGVAGDYLSHGAAAISVLTEPDYFKGNLKYLADIRARHDEALLLMKDFVLDSYQLWQARVHGADAVLILLAMLNPKQAAQLYTEARALSLTPLVEVHSSEEMKQALDLGAELIGINNRDLKTMTVSLGTSAKLAMVAKLATKDTILISESGIRDAADLRRLRALGFRGYLVGTHLMRTGTPGRALADLIRGAM